MGFTTHMAAKPPLLELLGLRWLSIELSLSVAIVMMSGSICGMICRCEDVREWWMETVDTVECE